MLLQGNEEARSDVDQEHNAVQGLLLVLADCPSLLLNLAKRKLCFNLCIVIM